MKITSKDAAQARQLIGLVSSHFRTLALRAAIDLDLPKYLAEKPSSVEALAKAVHADSAALLRLLRALAVLEIVTEPTPGSFQLTSLGQFLRSDHPASLKPLVTLAHSSFHWESWEKLTDAVRTGKSAFEIKHGEPFFTWLGHEHKEGQIFDAWMTRATELQIPDLLAAYDYSWAKTVVDVGGGQGAWLFALLEKYPQMNAILFDMPSVVEPLKAKSQPRLQVIGGDFFKDIPAKADLYLLKTILHDWDDEACIKILKNCQKVLPKHGKLLIAEMLLPSDGKPSPAYFMDLNMLVLNKGGKERTQDEYAQLCKKAGLNLKQAIPTASGLFLLEVEP